MDMKILDYVIFGNRISDFLAAVLTSFISLWVVRIIIRAVIRHFKKIAQKTKTEFDDFIAKILEKVALPCLYLTCFYLGLKVLKFSAGLDGIINALQLAVILFFVSRIVILLLAYGLKVYLA
ncbi:MAG TPA: hypothetical protein PKU74_07795, partial [Candidatus Omnitrophota bacterium]|nr:hypothetical protein [Candidatus Omnitrophota bacterium]